jgi:hypothetical protein
MVMKIYVSGPVVDSLDDKKLPLISSIYRLIERKVPRSYELDLPVRTAELSKLSANEFYETIQKQISLADGVFTVLAPYDQSTPVEAATAAINNKPQCILALTDVPRLIAGLPNIIEISPVDKDKLEDQVGYLVDRLLGELGQKDKPEAGSPD